MPSGEGLKELTTVFNNGITVAQRGWKPDWYNGSPSNHCWVEISLNRPEDLLSGKKVNKNTFATEMALEVGKKIF